MLTDATGTTVWRAVYEPFGRATVDEDPDGDGEAVVFNMRFPGQYYDAETGLHYNYFRDYDPATGRYIESDPIGLNGGLNTYLYANGNPIIFYDVYGLAYSPGEHGAPYSPGPITGTASLGGGGGIHLGPFGGHTTAGKTFGTDGEICEFVTVCLRTGWGYYAGTHGGFSFGINGGGSPYSGGWSLGAGYDVAVGVGGGANANVGSSGATKSGPSGNLGLGGSIGVDVCYTKIFNCQCSLN